MEPTNRGQDASVGSRSTDKTARELLCKRSESRGQITCSPFVTLPRPSYSFALPSSASSDEEGDLDSDNTRGVVAYHEG